MIDAQAITIWTWKDAPTDLAALSDHGGDEKWVALVPKRYTEREFLGWLDGIDTRRTPQVLNHPSLAEYEVWIGGNA